VDTARITFVGELITT